MNIARHDPNYNKLSCLLRAKARTCKPKAHRSPISNFAVYPCHHSSPGDRSFVRRGVHRCRIVAPTWCHKAGLGAGLQRVRELNITQSCIHDICHQDSAASQVGVWLLIFRTFFSYRRGESWLTLSLESEFRFSLIPSPSTFGIAHCSDSVIALRLWSALHPAADGFFIQQSEASSETLSFSFLNMQAFGGSHRRSHGYEEPRQRTFQSWTIQGG
jgi:hypothetical protein